MAGTKGRRTALNLAGLRTEVYNALELGFRRVTAGQLSLLASGRTAAALSRAAHLLPVAAFGDWEAHFRNLREEVKRQGAAAVAQELAPEYATLFLGPDTLPCPPYASVYLDGGAVMGRSTLDVMRTYRATGLRVAESWKEPEDHICLELAFMARLADRYSSSLREPSDEESRRLLLAQLQFLRNHLLRWAPAFAERLLSSTSANLYRFLGEFLPGWLRLDEELLRSVAYAPEVGTEAACQ